MAKIIETDMYGGDYPNEKELRIPRSTREENDYKLQPGFEP